jgi:hypothetical protein
MKPETFWLLGLLAIGVVGFILAKAVPLSTPKEVEKACNIVSWAATIATLWIICGGVIMLAYFAGK